MRPILLCALVAVGCRISPDYSGTEYQCPDGVCPPGFHCVAERCVADGNDGGNGADADNADGGGGADADNADGGGIASCGHTAVMHEEFASDALPDWAEASADPGASVDFENGRAVLRVPTDPPADPTATLGSLWRYDLRGDELTIEVAEMLNPEDPAEATFLFFDTWHNYAEFLQAEGTLGFNLWIDNIRIANAAVDYNSTEYRWWRFREAEGTLHFDTSPDGADWTTRLSTTAPYFTRRARFLFTAGSYSGAMNPGTFEIESVNGSSPPEAWCPAESFSDDFDDDTTRVDWLPYSDECTLVESSGRIRIEPHSDVTSACGYTSTTLFDLRDSHASIEVPVIVEPTGDAIAFLLVETGDNVLDLAQQGGLLDTTSCTPSCTSQGEVSYDSGAHRWWRIREEAGTVYWEASANGTSWQNLASAATPFDVSAVAVVFGVTVLSADESPGAAEFDNYNIP